MPSTEMNARKSVAGVAYNNPEVAATDEKEEREAGGGYEPGAGRPPRKSSAGTRHSGIFDSRDSNYLKSVVAKIDTIETTCSKVIQKLSAVTPDLGSCCNLQLSSSRDEAEQIRSRDKAPNALHSRAQLGFKLERSRSSEQKCGKAGWNVIGQRTEQLEHREMKGGSAEGPGNVKSCDEKERSVDNGRFEHQIAVTDFTRLRILGSKAGPSCVEADPLRQCVLPVVPHSDNAENDGGVQLQASEENCSQTENEFRFEDAKNVEACWEQVARMLSGNILTATPVIVRGSSSIGKHSNNLSDNKERSPISPFESDKEDAKRNLHSSTSNHITRIVSMNAPTLYGTGSEQVETIHPAKPAAMGTHNQRRSLISPHELEKEDLNANVQAVGTTSNKSARCVPMTGLLVSGCGKHIGTPEVDIVDPVAATNKVHGARSRGVEKKGARTLSKGEGSRSGKSGQEITPSVSIKKLLRLAANSDVLKKPDGLMLRRETELPVRNDKRKSPLTGVSDRVEKSRRRDSDSEEDSSTKDGKDELKKQDLSRSSDDVPYEHYVRQPEGSICDGERESSLASVWDMMALARAAAPTAESELSHDCGHENIDCDEDIGLYCEDCGCNGWKMTLKGCLHAKRLWKDEVGEYCEDCGLAGTDIQKIFIPTKNIPLSRKRNDFKLKEYATTHAKELQFNLQVSPRSDEDFCGARLELGPVFERNLHPHQKDGFTFLAKHLIDDKQGNSVGCILAHAPGTGKTCLMVSFIQSFLTRFPGGRVLILAPKIMLKSWQNEFGLWKVDNTPLYCLNECAYTENVAETEYELQETLEHDAQIPAHVNKTLKENRAKILQDWRGGKGVLITSYTLFANMIDPILDAKVGLDALTFQMRRVVLDGPDLVVLDEGHLARTKRTKILKSLQQIRTKRRVILSGTLFHNNFKELYTLLKLCRDDFMRAHPFYSQQASRRSGAHSKLSVLQQEENMFQDEIGEVLEKHVKDGTGAHGEISQAVETLRLLTTSFVHYYPGNILETLPGLVEYSILLNLTDVQEKTISSLPPTKGSNNSLGMRTKVFSACIHPSLVMGHRTNPYSGRMASAETEPIVTSEFGEAFQGVKIEFLIRLLHLCKQAHERMVIFCTTLGPLNYIQDMLLRRWGWKLGHQILRLDGTMAEVNRQEVIKLFNLAQPSDLGSSSRVHLLLASTKACKEGISLVGASRVVILDNHDNPSVLRQAVSRAFRIGQKKKVFVYRLLTNHKEEVELFYRSVNKERISKVLLDTFGQTKTRTQMEEFLQPIHSPSEVEDVLLQKLMLLDERKRLIYSVHRYNASGSFKGAAGCSTRGKG